MRRFTIQYFYFIFFNRISKASISRGVLWNFLGRVFNNFHLTTKKYNSQYTYIYISVILSMTTIANLIKKS